MIANQFKRKENGLYECVKCGEEVESGALNIVAHYEYCKVKMRDSLNESTNAKKIYAIRTIAISEVPVNEKSPVYLLFHHRKLIAQKISNVDNDNTLELLTDMIEYCNGEIKKYLGIW